MKIRKLIQKLLRTKVAQTHGHDVTISIYIPMLKEIEKRKKRAKIALCNKHKKQNYNCAYHLNFFDNCVLTLGLL